ncbi:circadian clock KaiB family protein [Methanothermobacter sp.]|uniref:circadian clock KaiB family protein n=1 Tax=Methanothermobacter sp. TaxID=1884223 RepID=UPI003C75E71B
MIHLRIYIAGDNLSAAALENLRNVMGDDAKLEVVDVRGNPEIARENGIIAIPTLERISPSPMRRVIGDLNDPDALRRFIGI